jgi:hypothetical protein
MPLGFLRREHHALLREQLAPKSLGGHPEEETEPYCLSELSLLAPQQPGTTRVHVLPGAERLDQALLSKELCRDPQLSLHVVPDHDNAPGRRGDRLPVFPPVAVPIWRQSE